MKKFLKYFICCVAAITLLACSKEEKPSIINLNTNTLTFKSYSSTQNVVSRGAGFELDTVVMDGKDIADRSDKNGDLFLDAGWIQIITPGTPSGSLARQMSIFVKSNNTGSDRECQILIHNGKVKEKVTVTQKKDAGEENK